MTIEYEKQVSMWEGIDANGNVVKVYTSDKSFEIKTSNGTLLRFDPEVHAKIYVVDGAAWVCRKKGDSWQKE
jgi:hypothetical protein